MSGHTPGPAAAYEWFNSYGDHQLTTDEPADYEMALRVTPLFADPIGPYLLKAIRPFVAMTFAEGRAAEDRGQRLLYCESDKLNPCWDGSWSKEHGPGKHWGGGDACPECNLRAAIAKATGAQS